MSATPHFVRNKFPAHFSNLDVNRVSIRRKGGKRHEQLGISKAASFGSESNIRNKTPKQRKTHILRTCEGLSFLSLLSHN